MTTSRLKIYNGALLILGERPLASVTEDRAPRRALDAVWDDDGVRFCLQQGQWNFAMRTARLDYNPAVEPGFGYRRAFDKLTDWVRTAAVCSDEFFRQPLLGYQDEVEYIFCDLDQIYVRYVSDDTSYGLDFSLWPANFTLYVEHYFASRIVRVVSTDRDLQASLTSPDRRQNITDKMLMKARSTDAQADPSAFPPPGGWRQARNGQSRERGNPHSLIG